MAAPAPTRRRLALFGAWPLLAQVPAQAAPAPVSQALADGAACARTALLQAARGDLSLGAALLRLVFHDAGSSPSGVPNGSIRFELERNENVGPSLRAALGAIEAAVDRCSVSWSDAIAIGGAAAVEAAGGPRIAVALGRADAQGPDPPGLLPNGGFYYDMTRAYFQERGFSDEETIALCGAHTLGRWTSFLDVSKECMGKDGIEQWRCSREEGRRLPFDSSPDVFDVGYFQAISEAYTRRTAPPPTTRWKYRKDDSLPRLNLLPSDNSLMMDDDFRAIVRRFAKSPDDFFQAFSRAYAKLVG